MSHAARNWAKAQTVGNGVAKAVLLELADCANERGECWPSIGAICRVIEHQRNTVRDGVKLLIDLGLVERQERKTTAGGTLSPLWRLSLGAVSAGRMNEHAMGEGCEITPPLEIARGEGVETAPGGGAKPHRRGGAKSHPNPSLDTKEILKTPSTHTDPVPPPARGRACDEEEEEDRSGSGKVIQMPPPVGNYPRRALPLARDPDPPGFEDAWHRLYPANRGSYGLAKAAWKQVLASGAATVAELHDGIRCFPFILEEGNRYVMSMDKWLHGENWRPRPGSASALVAAAGELESLLAQSLAEQRAGAKQ